MTHGQILIDDNSTDSCSDYIQIALQFWWVASTTRRMFHLVQTSILYNFFIRRPYCREGKQQQQNDVDRICKRLHMYRRDKVIRLFYLLFQLVVSSADREVSHFIRAFASGNDTKVVTQLLLLQVSLGQILELTLGETKISRTGNSQFCAISGNNNIVGGKSSSLSSNLDLILQVSLE